MPTLDSHPSSKRVKALVIGNSGTGKTGALACLANAGYELFIVDLDAGLDILRSLVKPGNYKNVHYVTITQKFIGTRNGVAPKGAPTVYAEVMNLLNKWVDPDTKENFGPISDWGPERILVVDTFTALGESAYRFARAQNVRAVDEIDWRDYGLAQLMQEGLVDLVMSEYIKCNVIINAHIDYQEAFGDAPIIDEVTGEKEEHGYPAAIGKKLSPKIGRHFNTVIMTESTAYGNKVRRRIRTVSTGKIDLKNPVPHILEDYVDLDGGWVEIFDAIKTFGVTEPEEEKPKEKKKK